MIKQLMTGFVLVLSAIIYAQVGEVLWYRADQGVNTFTGVPAADNIQLTTWFDQATANGSQDGEQATIHPMEDDETDLPTMPYYKYNSTDNFNFNPVVHFDGTNAGQALQFDTPARQNQTIFTVFKSLGTIGQNGFYDAGLLYGGDYSSLYLTDDGEPIEVSTRRSDLSFGVRDLSRLVAGGGSTGDFNVYGSVQFQNMPAIGTLERNRINDEEVYYSMYSSGSTETSNENADPANTKTGEGRDVINQLRIGKHFSAYENGLASPKGKLYGSVAEVIVFDEVLSDSERAKVESYLAVKYGITLTGGTKQFGATVGNVDYDYVNSDGTVIRASDTTYKYDVFGLGRDDFYILNQRISRSNNPGDILTASTNSDFTNYNLDTSRTAIDGDKEFVLFANNQGIAVPVAQQTTELPAGVERRLNREWKVAQFNTDGTDISNISLRFDLSGITLTNAYEHTIVLLIDIDGDGDFTTGTVEQVSPASFVANSEVIFSNLNFTNGQIFTLGLLPYACYLPPAMSGTVLETKVGITSLNRAGADEDNWPMVRNGGWLALESKTKGFVVNRVAFTDADSDPATYDVPVGIPTTAFELGMLVYDTTNKCLKMYTTKEGEATPAWHCMSTPGCPDDIPIPKTKLRFGYWWTYSIGVNHNNFKNQLKNTANYGSSGIFKGIEPIVDADFTNISATLGTMTAQNLIDNFDIIATGYSNSMSASDATKLKEFTDAGGVLIMLGDGYGVGNALNTAFGGSGNFSQPSYDHMGSYPASARTLNNVINNGIFGDARGITIIGTAGQAAPPVGNIPADATIISYLNYSGPNTFPLTVSTTAEEYAGVFLTGTNGRAIFVYDEGIFRATDVSGTDVNTDQEKFIHNLFAYALIKAGFDPN